MPMVHEMSRMETPVCYVCADGGFGFCASDAIARDSQFRDRFSYRRAIAVAVPECFADEAPRRALRKAPGFLSRVSALSVALAVGLDSDGGRELAAFAEGFAAALDAPAGERDDGDA